MVTIGRSEPAPLFRVGQEDPDWTNARKPQNAGWFTMSCPFKGGPYYAFSFAAGGRLRSELFIDLGEAEANPVLFEALLEHQRAIEDVYRAPLT